MPDLSIVMVEDRRLNCCDRALIAFRSTRVGSFGMIAASSTVSSMMGRNRFEAAIRKLKALGYLSRTTDKRGHAIDELHMPIGPSVHIPRALFEHRLTAEAIDLWLAMKLHGPRYMRELEAHVGLKRKAIGRHMKLLIGAEMACKETRRAGGRFQGELYRIGPAPIDRATRTVGSKSGLTVGPLTAGPKSGPLLKRSPYLSRSSSSNTSRIAAREGREEVEHVQESVSRTSLTPTELAEGKAAIEAFNALKPLVAPCDTPQAFVRTVARRLQTIGGIEAWHRALGAIRLDDLLSGRLRGRVAGGKFRLMLPTLLSTDGVLGDVLARLLAAAQKEAARIAAAPWFARPGALREFTPEKQRALLDEHAGDEWDWKLLGPAPGRTHTIFDWQVEHEYRLNRIYRDGKLLPGEISPKAAAALRSGLGACADRDVTNPKA